MKRSASVAAGLLSILWLGCDSVKVADPLSPGTGDPAVDLSVFVGRWRVVVAAGESVPSEVVIPISRDSAGRLWAEFQSPRPGEAPDRPMVLVSKLGAEYVLSVQSVSSLANVETRYEILKVRLRDGGKELLAYVPNAQVWGEAIDAGVLSGVVRRGGFKPDDLYVDVTSPADKVKRFIRTTPSAFHEQVFLQLEKVS